MEKARAIRYRYDLVLKASAVLLFLFLGYEYFVQGSTNEMLRRRVEMEQGFRRSAEDKLFIANREKQQLSGQVDQMKVNVNQMIRQVNDQQDTLQTLQLDVKRCKELSNERLRNCSAQMSQGLNEQIANDKKILELTDTVKGLQAEVEKWKYRAENCLAFQQKEGKRKANEDIGAPAESNRRKDFEDMGDRDEHKKNIPNGRDDRKTAGEDRLPETDKISAESNRPLIPFQIGNYQRTKSTINSETPPATRMAAAQNAFDNGPRFRQQRPFRDINNNNQ